MEELWDYSEFKPYNTGLEFDFNAVLISLTYKTEQKFVIGFLKNRKVQTAIMGNGSLQEAYKALGYFFDNSEQIV